MQYTPNFNFMIAEGTDTVNLLTQCYPNFTNLDIVLQAIKEAGVTEAVTTKVGTVHNIVRNVAVCNVIRWVNTANYAAGDTFTVDGTPVTATTMDGQSLPAGAFVINQSCLAILNGTVLTFVGGVGASTVAAQDVTYDNTGSGLTATDVQNAIDEVAGDIPTGFAATAITYDNSGSGLTATDAQDAIDELAAAIPSGEYVEVVADGVKTGNQLLNALFLLIDLSKVTYDSYFVALLSGSIEGVAHLYSKSPTQIVFTKASIGSSVIHAEQYSLNNGSSNDYVLDGTNQTYPGTNVTAAGTVYRVYY